MSWVQFIFFQNRKNSFYNHPGLKINQTFQTSGHTHQKTWLSRGKIVRGKFVSFLSFIWGWGEVRVVLMFYTWREINWIAHAERLVSQNNLIQMFSKYIFASDICGKNIVLKYNRETLLNFFGFDKCQINFKTKLISNLRFYCYT